MIVTADQRIGGNGLAQDGTHLDELDCVRGIVKRVYVELMVAVLLQEWEDSVSGAYIDIGMWAAIRENV